MIKVYKHLDYHWDFECIFKYLEVKYVTDPKKSDYISINGEFDYPIFKDVHKDYNIVYSHIREKRVDNVIFLPTQFCIKHPNLKVFALSSFEDFGIENTTIIDAFELDAWYRIFHKKECIATEPKTDANKFLFLGGKPNKPNRQPLYNLLLKKNYAINGISMLHDFSHSPDNAQIENNHYLGYPYSPWLYNNTKISLISETHYKNKEIFFPTEKTYRAIANLHPFVIASTPNFLQELRKRGYKTFGSLFDESYDRTYDEKIRLKKVVRSLKEAMTIPNDKYKEICEYNKKVLIRNATNTLHLIYKKLEL
jgi:hypothetical protein